MEIAGKVAIVTGAARRVGRAIALELGRAGAKVVVHHHASPSEADEVVRGIQSATAVQADLRDRGSTVEVLRAAEQLGGGCDILVNSAADFGRAAFEDLTDQAWDGMLELNLLAPMRLARAAVPGMRARAGGVIVNIIDVAGLSAWRGYAHYCAAKAALAMLTRCLALELAPTIRTVGIAPGTVQFPESFSADQRRRIEEHIPLGRSGTPDDVARAVRFLVESDFINGAILPVDGGRLVGMGDAL